LGYTYSVIGLLNKELDKYDEYHAEYPTDKDSEKSLEKTRKTENFEVKKKNMVN
jgi:hypothetical protein